MDQLNSVQISEWEAYDKLDPIGTWRSDFQMAMLASIITNIAIGLYAEKGTKMTTPLDFMPDWSGDLKMVEKPMQTVEEMKEIFLLIAGAQNSRIAEEKKNSNL